MTKGTQSDVKLPSVPDAETFRLHMGELTTDQVRIAQSAYRLALAKQPAVDSPRASAATRQLRRLGWAWSGKEWHPTALTAENQQSAASLAGIREGVGYWKERAKILQQRVDALEAQQPTVVDGCSNGAQS